MFKNLIARRKARLILKEKGILNLDWSLGRVKDKDSTVEDGYLREALEKAKEFLILAEAGAEDHMNAYNRIEQTLHDKSLRENLKKYSLVLSDFSFEFLKLAAKK